jgi:hypothetical protein
MIPWVITAGDNRYYEWTACNALFTYKNQAGAADLTIFAQYQYDAGGNRVSKLVRTGAAGAPIYEQTIYIDGIFEYHKLDDGTVSKKTMSTSWTTSLVFVWFALVRPSRMIF